MATPKYVGPRFERRRHWLSILVSESGGPKAVGLAVETPASHISAMCTGSRGVGDELADRLEKKFQKPNGWLDRPFAGKELTTPPTLHEALVLIGRAIASADDLTRIQIAPLLDRIAKDPDRAVEIAERLLPLLGAVSTPRSGRNEAA